jgi:hypothetical protein
VMVRGCAMVFRRVLVMFCCLAMMFGSVLRHGGFLSFVRSGTDLSSALSIVAGNCNQMSEPLQSNEV